MDAAILVRGLMFSELLGFVHVAGRSICGGDWKAKKSPTVAPAACRKWSRSGRGSGDDSDRIAGSVTGSLAIE